MRSQHKETIYKRPFNLSLRVVITLGILFLLPTSYVVAAIMVNSEFDNLTANNGLCTLREAAQVAGIITTTGDCLNPDGSKVIQFNSSLQNQTITLTSNDTIPDSLSRLYINTNLIIDALDNQITLDGGSAGKRVIRVASGKTVEIRGMTIRNGGSPFSAAGSFSPNEGGGIYNEGTLTITNCVIENNLAKLKGGGIYSIGSPMVPSTLILNRTSIYNNQTRVNGSIPWNEGGGGVLNDVNSSLTINNSTISGNQVMGSNNKGGGIFNLGNTVVLTNNTITNNDAKQPSGAIYNANGTVTIASSIVSGNFKSGSPDFDCGGSNIVSGGYNQLAAGCVTTLASTDTLVTNSQLSNVLGTFTGSYYPLKLSAGVNSAVNAIPSGTNGCGTAPLNQDQIGATRPQGNNCDIGAYEVQQPTVTYTFSLNSLSEKEDAAGTLHFTVNQVQVPNCGPTTIEYSITGTASPPSAPDVDYQHDTPTNGQTTSDTTGTISLNSGQQGSINLGILPDLTVEPDETITVTLANPTLVSPTCPEIPTYFASPQFILPSAPITFTIKNDDLAVTAINRLDPNPTNADSVSYTVVFSDGVIGVDAGDFTTTNSAPITSVTPIDNKNYTVVVDISGSGSGDFQLKLLNSATINSINPDLTFNGEGLTGETYTIDRSRPAVTQLEIAPNSYEVDTITIKFSEAVYDFDLSDLQLIRDSGSNLLTSAQPLTTTDNITWTLGNLVTLTEIIGNYKFTVLAAGITNYIGNSLLADADKIWERLPPVLNITKAGEGNGKVTAQGINCGTVCTNSYAIGAQVSLTATPNEDSYFDHWEGDCTSTSPTLSLTMTKAIKVINCTATFHKKTSLTLNISKTGEGSGTITGAEINCGTQCSFVYFTGKVINLTMTPAEGSYFGGWAGDCTTSSFTMKANMNCIASFYKKSDPPGPSLSETMILTLTQQGTGEGEFVFQPAIPADRIDCDTDKKQCRYSIDTASWVKVTAEPHSDSRWVGWTGANPKCYQNQGNRLEFFMSQNYSCMAEFESNPKVLSLVTIGNGQVTISPVGNSIPCETGKCFQFAGNSEVTLTPQAGNEFHFDNWSGDPDCQDGQVKMDTDKICVATFGDTPSVNLVLIYDQSQGQIALTPAGENCGYRCQRYKRDTLVTLTAQPQSGFQLASWGSNCSSQTQATLGIILDKDFRCEVTFMPATNPPPVDPSQPTYSLTVNSKGGGFGTITSLPGGIHCGLNCTGLYPANTTVTVQAEPAPNSVFVGWDESCPQGQVYLNANKTCLATFEVPGVVEWTSPTQINVTEEDKPVILRVSRLGGKYGAATVDYIITDNTTTAGSDYNATAGTLTWAVGDNTEKTVTLTILPDKLKEEAESLTVTLVNPQGGVRLGTSTTTVVHIADVPAFSSIQLAMPKYSVNEGGKKEAIIFATRAGKSLGTVSTDFKTIDGTAIANNDYTPVSGTLTWADGDRTQQAIKIPILQDSLNENHETFEIQLSNLTGEAQFGQYVQATVTIVDTPSMGSLEFAQAEYAVNESAGKVTIQVNRIGDNSGEISINYMTTNEGSAQAGADFTPSQGILQWTNGDSEPKSFDIPISVDEQPEGEETVNLSLSNPTGGASLGAISTAILKITDVVDDPSNPPPVTEVSVIQFAGPTYEVLEQAAIAPLEGIIQVPVKRMGSNKGLVTVKYQTQDGTAIAGKHYQTNQGILTWADGEIGEQWIGIDTWDNKLPEENKYFSLSLSQPNGAVLGEYSQTTVLIQDDDGGTVGFSSKNNYLTVEKSAQAQIMVSRSNNSTGQVIVHYSTADGTAIADEDYIPSSGVLTWADGEYGNQTISIPIIADEVSEDNETIQLRLFDPQGQAVLVQPSEVAITIIETETTACEVTEKTVDCFLVLNTDSPTLSDIRITSRGGITGGRLAGQIQNAGRVQNVVLMPDSILIGGQVTGSLSGDPDQSTTAFIRHVKLKGAHLERVVIGEGCQFDQSTTFGEGVLFQTNELVPEEQNLAPILGYMEQAIFGQPAVKLRGDVLYLSAIEGLLGTINALPQLANFGWQIKLDPRYGFLTLDVGNLRFAAMPLQVNQTLTEMIEGISLGVTQQADGQVSFRNQNGREIITQPVVQDPTTLQEQLRQLGLNTITMLANGNLKVTLADGSYFSGRASLVAQRVPQETSLGLHYTEQPVYLIFEDDQGQYWQQFIYPAAADPQVLANQTEEFFLANDGQLQIRQGERVYQGRLDYLVVTGKQPRSGNLQFKDIADINGDQCGDYQIFYNSQENQVMFGQCSSH
ncbi:MAG: hypothetical protein HC877_03675 [Thioploca sp.]|nr:hypothetical protein [Thioploca sp.]